MKNILFVCLMLSAAYAHAAIWKSEKNVPFTYITEKDYLTRLEWNYFQIDPQSIEKFTGEVVNRRLGYVAFRPFSLCYVIANAGGQWVRVNFEGLEMSDNIRQETLDFYNRELLAARALHKPLAIQRKSVGYMDQSGIALVFRSREEGDAALAKYSSAIK